MIEERGIEYAALTHPRPDRSFYGLPAERTGTKPPRAKGKLDNLGPSPSLSPGNKRPRTRKGMSTPDSRRRDHIEAAKLRRQQLARLIDD